MSMSSGNWAGGWEGGGGEGERNRCNSLSLSLSLSFLPMGMHMHSVHSPTLSIVRPCLHSSEVGLNFLPRRYLRRVAYPCLKARKARCLRNTDIRAMQRKQG